MLPPPSHSRPVDAVATAQAAFHYRVVCEDGAYVRTGLELSSPHLYTVASQTVVEVLERCVNVQGLARLRIADGWISEMLNPLSGQRGPIVEQVPMEHPLKFRIVFPGGALVRSGVELSSGVVGTIPAGQEIVVTEKRFSNTPSYRCVPRLKLADSSGWISMRINSPPPNDTFVVELLGLARPGEMGHHVTNRVGPPLAHGAGMIEGEGRAYDDSDDDDEEEEECEGQDGGRIQSSDKRRHQPRHQHHQSCDASEKIVNALRPDIAEAEGAAGGRKKKKEDHSCLVCFSSHRNATFVHGETGHIACCLECARVLRGRGDPCPVCRLPVDTVIQHFWA